MTFYSVKQVAESLGLSKHAVGSLIRSGEIRAVDVSLKQNKKPRWRISAEDLEAFVLRRTHQAAPPRRKRRKRKLTKQYF